jgi:hypothetical protein
MGHRDTLLCDSTYCNASTARSATRASVRRAPSGFVQVGLCVVIRVVDERIGDLAPTDGSMTASPFQGRFPSLGPRLLEGLPHQPSCDGRLRHKEIEVKYTTNLLNNGATWSSQAKIARMSNDTIKSRAIISGGYQYQINAG